MRRDQKLQGRLRNLLQEQTRATHPPEHPPRLDTLIRRSCPCLKQRWTSSFVRVLSCAVVAASMS